MWHNLTLYPAGKLTALPKPCICSGES